MNVEAFLQTLPFVQKSNVSRAAEASCFSILTECRCSFLLGHQEISLLAVPVKNESAYHKNNRGPRSILFEGDQQEFDFEIFIVDSQTSHTSPRILVFSLQGERFQVDPVAIQKIVKPSSSTSVSNEKIKAPKSPTMLIDFPWIRLVIKCLPRTPPELCLTKFNAAVEGMVRLLSPQAPGSAVLARSINEPIHCDFNYADNHSNDNHKEEEVKESAAVAAAAAACAYAAALRAAAAAAALAAAPTLGTHHRLLLGHTTASSEGVPGRPAGVPEASPAPSGGGAHLDAALAQAGAAFGHLNRTLKQHADIRHDISRSLGQYEVWRAEALKQMQIFHEGGKERSIQVPPGSGGKQQQGPTNKPNGQGSTKVCEAPDSSKTGAEQSSRQEQVLASPTGAPQGSIKTSNNRNSGEDRGHNDSGLSSCSGSGSGSLIPTPGASYTRETKEHGDNSTTISTAINQQQHKEGEQSQKEQHQGDRQAALVEEQEDNDMPGGVAEEKEDGAVVCQLLDRTKKLLAQVTEAEVVFRTLMTHAPSNEFFLSPQLSPVTRSPAVNKGASSSQKSTKRYDHSSAKKPKTNACGCDDDSSVGVGCSDEDNTNRIVLNREIKKRQGSALTQAVREGDSAGEKRIRRCTTVDDDHNPNTTTHNNNVQQEGETGKCRRYTTL